jgi:hypothetical protein
VSQKRADPAPLAISDATDCSIDWLCGFDVPRDRNERAKAGDLEQALGEHLRERFHLRGVPTRFIDKYVRDRVLDRTFEF